MRPVWFFLDKGDYLVNSSSKLLIAVLAFLLLSFFLPSGGGERSSLTSLSFQNAALAATETTSMENEEEAEPFKEASKVEYAPDPLEPMNRAFFVFNDKLYFWFLKPVSQIYGIFIPPGIRTCIKNGFDNLRFPTRFVNNVLQGKFKAAGIETGRFLINSTFGFAGFFEAAGRDFALPPPPDEDTGQTLGFYGLKPGFYLVIPVLGPSSLRDGFGLAGDTFLNPLYYLPYFTSLGMWDTVGIRAGMVVNNASLRIGEYEDFKKAALDPYASMRQAYLQNRQNEILK
jgi:phospholipid-binding lipoprotein MlaA